MKVTLRKSAALQVAIIDRLKALEIPTTANVSIYEKPDAQIEAVHAIALERLKTGTELIAALSTLRLHTSTANHEAGINAILTEIAILDRTELLFGKLGVFPRYSTEALAGRYERTVTMSRDARFGGGDTFIAPVLTPEDLKKYQASRVELARRKQALKDKLIFLNGATQFEIGADTEQILQTNDII